MEDFRTVQINFRICRLVLKISIKIRNRVEIDGRMEWKCYKC